MAQAGYTPISLYYSTTAAAAPTAGNLVNGELALNITDGKLYYKDNGGVVQLLAAKGSGVPGGSTTQVQYNNAGAFAGSANMTFNGTSLTLANDASIAGLTVGNGAANLATTVVFGQGAQAASDGGSTTAIGAGALAANTASNNTAVGYQAGYTNTVGSYNVCLGYQAGYSFNPGSASNTNNVFVGAAAGYNVTTGNQNCFVGNAAGFSVTTGTYNVILGAYQGNSGGLDIRAANNYVVLSDGAADIRLVSDNLGITSIPSTTYSPNINLTDAATIAWDTSLGQVATFTFVSSNRTVGAPTNLVNGGFYALAVIQNGGSNTLTWNAVFKFPGGTAPTLSTAAGAKDYFVFRSDGTNMYLQGSSLAVA